MTNWWIVRVLHSIYNGDDSYCKTDQRAECQHPWVEEPQPSKDRALPKQEP